MLWTWFKSRLVPDVRVWWKLHSVQLGVLATGVLTYLAANPDAWTKFVAQLPAPIAATIPVWVGTVVGGTIFFARFWKQYSGDIIAVVKTTSATDSTVKIVPVDVPPEDNNADK